MTILAHLHPTLYENKVSTLFIKKKFYFKYLYKNVYKINTLYLKNN